MLEKAMTTPAGAKLDEDALGEALDEAISIMRRRWPSFDQWLIDAGLGFGEVPTEPLEEALSYLASTRASAEGGSDNDLQQCEHCSKEFPIEQMTTMSDCWFCQGCYDDFKKHFDACEHEWTPRHNEHGDPGKHCHKCSGFVCDDFPAEPSPTPPDADAVRRAAIEECAQVASKFFVWPIENPSPTECAEAELAMKITASIRALAQGKAS